MFTVILIVEYERSFALWPDSGANQWRSKSMFTNDNRLSNSDTSQWDGLLGIWVLVLPSGDVEDIWISTKCT